MKEIREAYCSYELSKRLKEEGFNEPCNGYFYEGKPSFLYADGLSMSNSDWNEEISAPTHQMAMAWLREKGYYIIVEPYHAGDEATVDGFMAFVLYDGLWHEAFNCPFDSYEEATDDAIKYCLDIIDETRTIAKKEDEEKERASSQEQIGSERKEKEND